MPNRCHEMWNYLIKILKTSDCNEDLPFLSNSDHSGRCSVTLVGLPCVHCKQQNVLLSNHTKE